jgi:hypothetical protein
MGFGIIWPVVILAFAGAVLGLLAFTGRLSGFGRLPGDIRFSGRRMKVYAPLTSMLLLSLLLSVLLTLLGWLFG